MSTQPDDPPVTRASVRSAIDAANEERQRFTRATGKVIPLHPMPSAEDCHRRDGIDALTLLVSEHGVSTVYRWLRNIAIAAGENL